MHAQQATLVAANLCQFVTAQPLERPLQTASRSSSVPGLRRNLRDAKIVVRLIQCFKELSKRSLPKVSTSNRFSFAELLSDTSNVMHVTYGSSLSEEA